MFSPFYVERSYLLFYKSFQNRTPPIWGLALCSSPYRIKHTRAGTSVWMRKQRTVSDVGTQIWKPCQHKVAFFTTQAWASFSFYSRSGFVFTLTVTFHTYSSSWTALSSEAPWPSSGPCLPCCSALGHPLTFTGDSENPFASLCPSWLVLRVTGWLGCRHRHVADRLCFSVSA